MSMFDLFTWLTAGLSLLGTVMNVRRDRRCFHIWCGTNAAWTAIDVVHGVWAQAALQAVYFGLAVWGVYSWKRAT